VCTVHALLLVMKFPAAAFILVAACVVTLVVPTTQQLRPSYHVDRIFWDPDIGFHHKTLFAGPGCKIYGNNLKANTRYKLQFKTYRQNKLNFQCTYSKSSYSTRWTIKMESNKDGDKTFDSKCFQEKTNSDKITLFLRFPSSAPVLHCFIWATPPHGEVIDVYKPSQIACSS